MPLAVMNMHVSMVIFVRTLIDFLSVYQPITHAHTQKEQKTNTYTDNPGVNLESPVSRWDKSEVHTHTKMESKLNTEKHLPGFEQGRVQLWAPLPATKLPFIFIHFNFRAEVRHVSLVANCSLKLNPRGSLTLKINIEVLNPENNHLKQNEYV